MQLLKVFSKAIILMLLLIMLSGCTAEKPVQLQAEIMEEPDTFRISRNDENDCPASFEEINLNECDSDLYITEGGTYRFVGNLAGTVYVDTLDENIQLVLAGASIEAKGTPAIMVVSSGKLIITAEEGTNNQLKDSGLYISGLDADACVYAESDITINGKGSLTITGLYKDAVCSKDTLKVMTSDLLIRSKRDGLRGNDGVYMAGDNIRIESERNGIRTKNTGEHSRGNVEISGKDISIISGKYCIDAAKDLYIHDAALYIEGVWGEYRVDGRIVIKEDAC